MMWSFLLYRLASIFILLLLIYYIIFVVKKVKKILRNFWLHHKVRYNFDRKYIMSGVRRKRTYGLQR